MTDNRKNFSPLSINRRKDSSFKLPYPVLSDHRDLSSILNSLQKETQTTSKKLIDVIKHIDECERRLTSSSSFINDFEKKSSKSDCVKFKQQLDALKKHERRLSLQIDFITTKNEIKNLEDEQHSHGNEQIQILVKKLNQKLDKMKIYMRTRNEQMKKQISIKDQRRLTVTDKDQSNSNKRLKSTTSIIRLTSRITSEDSKKHLITTSSKISKSNNKRSLIDEDDEDNDDELDLDLDELFNDDLYSEQTVHNFKSQIPS